MWLTAPFYFFILWGCLVAKEFNPLWVEAFTTHFSDVVSDLIANDSISVCYMAGRRGHRCSDRDSLIWASFEEMKSSISPGIISSAVKPNGKVFSRFHKSEKDHCHDISEYKYVIDLTCSHEFDKAYFHFQFDCLLGNHDLLTVASEMNNPATIILVPKYNKIASLEWLRVVSPNEVFREGHHLFGLHDISRKQCFSLHRDATVIYASSKKLWVDFYTYPYVKNNDFRLWRMHTVASTFRARIKEYVESRYIHEIRSILWIQRNQTRRIINSGRLIKSLKKKFPHLRLIKYHGDEPADIVVKKFYTADIVVGFHGAGLVNTIYCKEGTLVVEFTVNLPKQEYNWYE